MCLNASGAEMGRVRGVVLVPESSLTNFMKTHKMMHFLIATLFTMNEIHLIVQITL